MGEIMFWLESCTRCHGDLFESNDNYGGFIRCLQCGHYLTESEEDELKFAPTLIEPSGFPPAGHIKIPAA